MNNKELLDTLYPQLDILMGVVRALEDAEEIAELARELQSRVKETTLEVNELKKQNYAMQVFIEEHVPEEKKKLIFKD